MTSRDIADLCPALQHLCQQFIAQCQAAGIKVGIDCTYRSNAEQDIDYARGRTSPGAIITNARAGQSPHNCTESDGTPAARAFDIYVLNADGTCNWNIASPIWHRVGEIGAALGLTWGGGFHSLPDYPHFQIDPQFPIPNNS
jgi:peptidoglycan L-alanyl-D-glutamate endopeptidase CwlK